MQKSNEETERIGLVLYFKTMSKEDGEGEVLSTWSLSVWKEERSNVGFPGRPKDGQS